MDNIQATFIGTGTSQGVPVIACYCEVCKSTNQKDIRLRTSLLIHLGSKNIIIDTGPDFRQQMLENDVQNLDAILFTHAHKDHIAGMDDIRAFNYQAKKAMEIYGSELTLQGIKHEFHYVFIENSYPGIPKVNLNYIDKKPFEIIGEKIIPIEVMHYKLPVQGFRIRDFTYITDAKTISESEMTKIQGTKVLVVNALRKEEHISHFNLEEALHIIEQIAPKQAYLTHISHLMGKHEEIEKTLPANVKIAYDGLKIDLK